uniref:Uncharacterized protein n=1 Tax=Oryza brachyantha TaxID=4533 RepID=J3M3W3_ORYBR
MCAASISPSTWQQAGAGDDDRAAVCVDMVAKIGRRRQREDAAAVVRAPAAIAGDGVGVGVGVAVDRVEEIGGNGVDIWAQIFIDQMKWKMNSH